MRISERQNLILNKAIEEYILSAQPVSSSLLEKKYDFGISPAMIRIEMQKLTEGGFLLQPHTSAGRVPTDKGYRLFVDELLQAGVPEFKLSEDFEMEIKADSDIVNFTRLLSKNLASISSAIAVAFLGKEKILWKEGWEEVLREPEFREQECLFDFAEFLKNFEKNIENLKTNSGIKIYIGRENPFSKAKGFSIISSRYELRGDEEVVLALLGPKRMSYERNISLINSLAGLLEKF